MNGRNTHVDELNALNVAMHAYDVAASDKITELAAFGVACNELRRILNINLVASALLIRGELERRELIEKAEGTKPPARKK